MDKTTRMTAAIDILKAAIACDTYPMIVIENRFGRGSKDRSLDAVRKGLAELALDVLCGEQPITEEPKYPSEASRRTDRPVPHVPFVL